MASDQVSGVWFPAGASRRHEARLSLAADGEWLVEADGAVMARGFPDEVEVSQRIGSIPRRISFADGSLFETLDNDGVDRLRGIDPSGRGVDGLERFRPRLFIFAAVAIALCWAIYRFAVPVLVEVAVAVTPPVVPQMMSQGALASLDQLVTAPTELDEESRAKISAGFAELARASKRGEGGYTLNFRKGGTVGPNAFALPDGNIVLTDELVAMVGDDSDAVLGVLAHEIGHVDREHTLRQLYRAAGIAGLIMLIGGDIGSAAEDILVQGSALVSLSYSRTQESEADRSSVDLMFKTGRDPEAIIRFFKKLEDEVGASEGTSILSTHPDTAGRMEAVKAYADQARKGG
ncbi:MAG: M48 family metallopeptidase [Mesorhizobium sp.]